tara:strand:+ start:21 stop:464 length:444 start_codon:yes stop_codon:yes gene_type:complete
MLENKRTWRGSSTPYNKPLQALGMEQIHLLTEDHARGGHEANRLKACTDCYPNIYSMEPQDEREKHLRRTRRSIEYRVPFTVQAAAEVLADMVRQGYGDRRLCIYNNDGWHGIAEIECPATDVDHDEAKYWPTIEPTPQELDTRFDY